MAQIFWYCLAVAARDTNILVHAAVLMSTHPHYDVTDQDGRLPGVPRCVRWSVPTGPHS